MASNEAKQSQTVIDELQSEIETLKSTYNDKELKVDIKDTLITIVYSTTLDNTPIEIIFMFKPNDIRSTIAISLQLTNPTKSKNNLTETTINLIMSQLTDQFNKETNTPIYQTIEYFNNVLKKSKTSKPTKPDTEIKYDGEEKKTEIEQIKKKPKSYDKCPSIQLLARDGKGWTMYTQDTKTGKLHNISGKSKPCADANIIFSNDGKYFAVLQEATVQIHKSSKCKLVNSFKHDRVRKVYFSPLNKFIVSYAHHRNSDTKGNCFVWKWSKSECKLIHQFFVLEFNDKAVPFCFSNDEFIAGQAVKNKLLIYDLKQLKSLKDAPDSSEKAVIASMDVEKIVSVVIAPCHCNKKQAQNIYFMGIFAKATSRQAATVSIYEYKHNKNDFKQISQRQFFGIDECTFKWDTAICESYDHKLLIIMSSNIDSYGKSYYGRQELFLMSTENSKTIKIEVKNKLQDVGWHPLGKEFVLIDDNPQRICIFDDRGKMIHTIGEYARNMIRFSTCGSFLWLGGFGNLTGEMTFYDYKNIQQKDSNDKKYLKGYNKQDTNACRYFEWSADSSVFVTAMIYPYMTVDNGFTIYKYNGCKLYEEKFDRLYQVAYRPSLYNVYPDKIVSIKALAQSLPIPAKEVIAKTRYVPPHLRNKGNRGRGKGKGTKRLFG